MRPPKRLLLVTRRMFLVKDIGVACSQAWLASVASLAGLAASLGLAAYSRRALPGLACPGLGLGRAESSAA